MLQRSRLKEKCSQKKNQQHQQIPRRVLTDILKNGSPKNNIKNNFRDVYQKRGVVRTRSVAKSDFDLYALHMSCGVPCLCGSDPRPPRPRVSNGLLVRMFVASILVSIMELEGVCFGGVGDHWDVGLVQAPFTSRCLPLGQPPLHPWRLAVQGLLAFAVVV